MPAITRVRVLLGLAAAAVILAASSCSGYLGYEVGGRIGFMEGFAAGSWSSDTTHAMHLTFILDKLHQGDVAEATASLEQQVDSGLLSYWAYTMVGDSKFDRSGVVAKSHDTIKRVAAYRQNHPAYYRDGDLGETISSLLGSLQRPTE